MKDIYEEFEKEFKCLPKTDSQLFCLMNLMLLEHCNYTFYAGGIYNIKEQILRGCLYCKDSDFKKEVKKICEAYVNR